MTAYRSCLGAHAASMRDPDPEQPYRMKKAAWHGAPQLLVVNLDTDLNWDGSYGDRELLRAIGNRLYGKRKDSANGKV